MEETNHKSINDDSYEVKLPGEDFPLFGRRNNSKRGCKLTLFLTLLVICAAAFVVVISIMIANREQISAELLLDIESVAADFAFWDPSKQVLYWVDRELFQIFMYDPINNNTFKIQLNHTIGVVVPRIPYNDSVIITSSNYVATYNLTTGEEQILAYLGNSTLKNNSFVFTDGRCDPMGSLWTGAASADGQTTGTLYKVDPFYNFINNNDFFNNNNNNNNNNVFYNNNNINISISPMLKNISTPGGMAWSRDRKTFFFIDSKNSQVKAYSYSPNLGLTFQRVAFVVPSSYGILSGLAIDSTDSLWVAIIGPAALNGTGRVCRYDAYLGQLQETILLPVSEVTSCVFGGPNLDQLYITTRHKTGEVHSGGIYVATRLGVVGAYPNLYAA